MSRFEAVLFDLDGTLVDTELTAARVVTRIFAAWSLPLAPEDAAFVTGRTWDSALSHLFSKYPPPKMSLEAASHYVLEQYRAALKNELVVVPGSPQAVQALSESYPLALVSGSHRSEIEWALQKLQIYDAFSVILGAEDYPRSKPAPDGYLEACRALGVNPENTLIFEDSDAGIASAKSIGAWVVAVTCTNHFRQDTSTAHVEVPDLSAVTPAWVEKQYLARGTKPQI